MSKMSCIILAGGKSTRLGFDKRQLVLEGSSILTTLVSRLSPSFEKIICVCNEQPLDESLGMALIKDEIQHQGPMGGIQAGLRSSKTEWNTVVGCDMPFVTLDFVKSLILNASDSVDAVIPLSSKGIEPLLALYSKRCLPAIDRLLESGSRKITNLLEAVRVRYVDYSGMDNGNQPSVFFNINTPLDLQSAQKISGEGS